MTSLRPLSELPAGVSSLGNLTNGFRCPKCGEHKTSAWRDGFKLVAHCWRNSCNYNAEFAAAPAPADESPTGPLWEPRHYERRLCTPQDECYQFLERKFGISKQTAKEFGTRWAADDGKALWFPIFGPYRENRGGVLRKFDGSTPKALTFLEVNCPALAWYKRPGTSGVVIVEDQLSAIRVWQTGRSAAAILGTALTLSKYTEIDRYTTGPLQLALDKDAYQKAIYYAKKYPRLRPVLLGKRDLKDVEDAEIEERLSYG